MWMHVECLDDWDHCTKRESTDIEGPIHPLAHQLSLCPIMHTDWYQQLLCSLDWVIMGAHKVAQNCKGRDLFEPANFFDIFVEMVADSVEHVEGMTSDNVKKILPDTLVQLMSIDTKYNCVKCGQWGV